MKCSSQVYCCDIGSLFTRTQPGMVLPSGVLALEALKFMTTDTVQIAGHV